MPSLSLSPWTRNRTAQRRFGLDGECRYRPLVEGLEDRLVPALAFTFTLDDPSNLFVPFPHLLPNLQAAGQILASVIDGLGSMDVVVHANNSIPRATGGTVRTTFVGTDGDFNVWENATITEARTGIDPNNETPDIAIKLNTESYLPTLFFDPSGAARTAPMPPGKTDFMSIALHEVMHSFGFQGWRQISGAAFGQFPSNAKSTYDVLTAFVDDNPANSLEFHGNTAKVFYGGPVPLANVGPSAFLTSQNFFHLGNPTGGPGDELIPDLMNGVVFHYATRYHVSNLDLAILTDLGWTTHPAPYVSNVVAVSPNPRRTPVSSIDVTFSEPIDVSTFTFADVGLKRDGVNVALKKSAKITRLASAAATYRISGLTNFTTAHGNYELNVSAAGVANLAGVAGVGTRQITWVMDKAKPKTVSVGPVSPTRTTPVDFIDVVTTEPINLATFTFQDVKLTRKGSKVNLLLSGATLTKISDTVYRIGNLTGLTGTAGKYVLTVNAEGITDLAGNLGVGTKQLTWSMTL